MISWYIIICTGLAFIVVSITVLAIASAITYLIEQWVKHE